VASAATRPFLPSLDSSNSTNSSERNRQFSHVEGEEEESGAKERYQKLCDFPEERKEFFHKRLKVLLRHNRENLRRQ
jgi:hypothetical protein